MTAYFASTDIITSTEGSAIGAISLGGAGFGDGYSTIVYTNSLTTYDANIGGFLYDLTRDETETVSDTQTTSVVFAGSIDEPQILVDAEVVLAEFVRLQNESFVLSDYQFLRGWIKINDNQNPNWVQINNNQ